MNVWAIDFLLSLHRRHLRLVRTTSVDLTTDAAAASRARTQRGRVPVRDAAAVSARRSARGADDEGAHFLFSSSRWRCGHSCPQKSRIPWEPI